MGAYAWPLYLERKMRINNDNYDDEVETERD